MSIGEDLDFRHLTPQFPHLAKHIANQRRRAFHRRYPTDHAAVQQLRQRMTVVQIQRRTAHERQLALGEELHRAHVVGLHQQLTVVAEPAQAGQFGGRFDQCQAGDHQLCLAAFL
ncbi:hypothetical protein D3C86_1538600 [compost metagenome]